MKRKSITENETTVNTPLNQFTYKLQKNKNQKQKKTTTNLLDLPNQEKKINIQEKLSKTNDLILSLFSFFIIIFFYFSRFHGNSGLN